MRFGSENCSTNLGSINSMETIILTENRNCFIAGYSFYLLHLVVDLNTTVLMI